MLILKSSFAAVLGVAVLVLSPRLIALSGASDDAWAETADGISVAFEDAVGVSLVEALAVIERERRIASGSGLTAAQVDVLFQELVRFNTDARSLWNGSLDSLAFAASQVALSAPVCRPADASSLLYGAGGVLDQAVERLSRAYWAAVRRIRGAMARVTASLVNQGERQGALITVRMRSPMVVGELEKQYGPTTVLTAVSRLPVIDVVMGAVLYDSAGSVESRYLLCSGTTFESTALLVVSGEVLEVVPESKRFEAKIALEDRDTGIFLVSVLGGADPPLIGDVVSIGVY